jgi:serine/threonine-protein kinase
VAEGPVDRLTAHIVHNYQVTGEIGRDATSRLFQATSPSLGTAVIIQVIPGELARPPDFGDRFQSRMRKAASLAHRNILHVNHFAHDEPNYYIVLDYFDGQPLARIMEARGRLAVPEVVSLLNQALEALDHAHKNGITHGALHPGGMLIADDGELRMTGFGIAKAIEPQSMLVETPGHPYLYKSPEQAMGLPVDARSDLYSLGLIVWQALVGKLPAAQEVPPPSTLNSEVPSGVDEVLMRMLIARPRDRFRTARQVAIALSGALHARGARRAGAVAPSAGPAPTRQQAPAAAPEVSPPAAAAERIAAIEAGIKAYQQGDMELATRLLEEAAQGGARSVRVLAHLGAAYYAARRYRDAAGAFRRALEIRPDLATVRYDLGNALLAQGDVAQARAELERAWNQDPKCTAALLLLVSLEGVSP